MQITRIQCKIWRGLSGPTLILALALQNLVCAAELTLLGSYVNNKDGIRGLDNVRQIHYLPSTNRLYAVSADDNAVSAFDIEKGWQLKTRTVITSAQTKQQLEGAVALAIDPKANSMFVTSFYSGSVVQFDLLPELATKQIFSDYLPPKQVFAQESTVTPTDDRLGLLGSYAISFSPDSQRFFVAANVS